MLQTLFISRHRALALLLAATALSFLVSHDRAIGGLAGIATLVLAFLKARLVLLDFMELRHAPLPWRWGFEGGLLAVTAALIVIDTIR
jgi:hypothetical protein